MVGSITGARASRCEVSKQLAILVGCALSLLLLVTPAYTIEAQEPTLSQDTFAQTTDIQDETGVEEDAPVDPCDDEDRVTIVRSSTTARYRSARTESSAPMPTAPPIETPNVEEEMLPMPVVVIPPPEEISAEDPVAVTEGTSIRYWPSSAIAGAPPDIETTQLETPTHTASIDATDLGARDVIDYSIPPDVAADLPDQYLLEYKDTRPLPAGEYSVEFTYEDAAELYIQDRHVAGDWLPAPVERTEEFGLVLAEDTDLSVKINLYSDGVGESGFNLQIADIDVGDPVTTPTSPPVDPAAPPPPSAP